MSENKIIEGREYQDGAINWLATKPLGMVVAAAGSGKTIIGAGALCKVVLAKSRSQRVKIGWVCNTGEQRQQAYDAIKLFPQMAGLIHFKAACAASNTDWSDRDVLVIDECHRMIAESWQAQIRTCPGTLWGFTATPETGDSIRDAQLRDFFGGNIYRIDRAAVQHKLAPAKVVMLRSTDAGLKEKIDSEIAAKMAIRRRFWRGDEGELWGMIAWQSCIDWGIVQNQQRNAAIIYKARQHAKDSVLILVNKIEHGIKLKEQLPGSRLCYSKMGKTNRLFALQAFREGKCRCLIATSLADEGLDVPIANVLILAAGGKSKARTEQRTGRILRQFIGKTHGQVYDFEDSWHPLAAKHSRARQSLYRSLGYEFVT